MHLIHLCKVIIDHMYGSITIFLLILDLFFVDIFFLFFPA